MIHPIVQREVGVILWIEGDVYECLKKKPRPILWVRKGIYGIIPVEVIRNEFQIRADREKLDPECWHLPLGFKWAEAQEIPQSTGTSMEKYDGQ
ncbi:hypothetical protein LCGC14_0356260 [marine sediment metagenome]|uniref:Uncharacterized protein n=1 Tax=marine sediment metagenome TaxID=412755 RepID=A0A0F9TF51_9ZZZZ